MFCRVSFQWERSGSLDTLLWLTKLCTQLSVNMRTCCVDACKNTSKSENVVFFVFPKTQIRCEWIKFTGRTEWLPSNNSTICSDHFSPYLIKGGKKLQKGAIPTLQSRDQVTATIKQGTFSDLYKHVFLFISKN